MLMEIVTTLRYPGVQHGARIRMNGLGLNGGHLITCYEIEGE